MKKDKIIKWIFAAYAIVMAILLFGRGRLGVAPDYWEQVGQNINYIPFKTIQDYLFIIIHQTNPHLIPHAVLNLSGNIFAFVPLGFFLPCLSKRMGKFGYFILTIISTVLCIEIVQLFTLRGSCDVDDFILNVAGSLIGFVIWKAISKRNSNKESDSLI